MSRVRFSELTSKSKDDLMTQLNDFKKELSHLRVAQQANGASTKLARIGTMRKNIARVLTALNQKQRDNLRKFAKDNNTPLAKSLRPKLTHRRRLALKSNELNRKTRRQMRVAAKFPKRVYAVKI